MHITQRELQRLFPQQEIRKGQIYREEGRIRSFHENDLGTGTLIRCTVDGTEPYRVSVIRMGDSFHMSCSCPAFDREGHCKHLAAALLESSGLSTRPAESSTDRNARSLLDHFLSNPEEEEAAAPQKAAVLLPRVSDNFGHSYPVLSFQVGYDRLYVIKDIPEFLQRVADGETAEYGKGLTLDHHLSCFDSRSQELIGILRGEYRQFRTIGALSWQDRYSGTQANRGFLELEGPAFDRLFDLFQDEMLPCRDTGGRILLTRKDPELTMHVEPLPGGASLQFLSEDPARYFGHAQQLYAMTETVIMRCSPAFRRAYMPLIHMDSDTMELAQADLPTFCSAALPALQKAMATDDPTGLLARWSPEECAACFYFDLADETLTGRLSFRYGDNEIRSDVPLHSDSGVRRDALAEQRASARLDRCMDRQEGPVDLWTLTGDDRIYDFLADTLDRFHNYGEVYVSDALRGRSIRRVQASVGISVSDGILSLDFDTGEFPAEELEALYDSLLRRRKYHRLSDGRYLTLDGSAVETLAEAVHMTQLSPAQLRAGHAELPAFRGLYLDSVLRGAEDLSVTRDSSFRAMVRSFRTVEESDWQVPESLKKILRPYQKTGFRWLKTLEAGGFGGILADEMGLGKTLETIAFLLTATRAEKGLPSLIVCPASLVLNWSDELTRFAPSLRVCLLLGNAAERRAALAGAGEADVLVTSYDLLKRDLEQLKGMDFFAMVLDEGQMIKNRSTLASRAVKSIPCRQRFILTGTPIENRLSELWNLFDFLMPGYLFTHSTFVEKLEKPIIQAKDADAEARLSRLVQPFILRRLKQDVLKELPPKISHVHRVALSEEERRTYLAAAAASRRSIAAEGQNKLQILAALTQLRQICCDPNLCFENYEGGTAKLDACLELCSSMVENGHQILLFSQFTSMLSRIRVRLDALGISSLTLQGSTPKEKRQQMVARFNAGGADVFLISLKAGGTGLNLTAADVVIHYDPWWNLAAQNQATDRAHRIGQQKSVHVYQLITQDTIEEKILLLQEKKAALMEIVSGDPEAGILSMSREDLLALLD